MSFLLPLALALTTAHAGGSPDAFNLDVLEQRLEELDAEMETLGERIDDIGAQIKRMEALLDSTSNPGINMFYDFDTDSQQTISFTCDGDKWTCDIVLRSIPDGDKRSWEVIGLGTESMIDPLGATSGTSDMSS